MITRKCNQNIFRLMVPKGKAPSYTPPYTKNNFLKYTNDPKIAKKVGLYKYAPWNLNTHQGNYLFKKI